MRKSGIELLRIISMFLLIWVHDNTYKFGSSFGQYEYILKDFLPILMVNIFIVITALHSEKMFGRWKSVTKKIFLYFGIAFLIKNLLIIKEDGFDFWLLISYIKDPINVIQGMPWFIKGYLITIITLQFIRVRLSIKQAIMPWMIFLIIPFIIWWFNSMNLMHFNILDSNGNVINIWWKYRITTYNWLLIFSLIVITSPVVKGVVKWDAKKIGICLFTAIAVKLLLDLLSINLVGSAYEPRGYNTLFNVIIPIFIVALFANMDFYSAKINKLGSITLMIYMLEESSGLGHLIRDNIFTEMNTLNYIMSITSRFATFVILAYLIQMIIDYVNSRLKNKT